MNHAINELEISLEILKTNEPIHRSEGKAEQADLCEEKIINIEAAIAVLKEEIQVHPEIPPPPMTAAIELLEGSLKANRLTLQVAQHGSPLALQIQDLIPQLERAIEVLKNHTNKPPTRRFMATVSISEMGCNPYFKSAEIAITGQITMESIRSAYISTIGLDMRCCNASLVNLIPLEA
jgi:hypothetical protein